MGATDSLEGRGGLGQRLDELATVGRADGVERLEAGRLEAGRLGGCSGDSGEVERTAEQGGRGRAERRGGWGSGHFHPCISSILHRRLLPSLSWVTRFGHCNWLALKSLCVGE